MSRGSVWWLSRFPFGLQGPACPCAGRVELGIKEALKMAISGKVIPREVIKFTRMQSCLQGAAWDAEQYPWHNNSINGLFCSTTTLSNPLHVLALYSISLVPELQTQEVTAGYIWTHKLSIQVVLWKWVDRKTQCSSSGCMNGEFKVTVAALCNATEENTIKNREGILASFSVPPRPWLRLQTRTFTE